MKFTKNNIVACIANSLDWENSVNDFNENLRIALGQINIPKKDHLYIINNPKKLVYKGVVYVTIIGFGDRPFSENAFVKVVKLDKEQEINKL